MSNVYEHQQCKCGHPWTSHEGSGGACAHVEPAENGGEPGPPSCAAACSKWDGQPYTLPEDPDEDEGDGDDDSGDDAPAGGEGGDGNGDDQDQP